MVRFLYTIGIGLVVVLSILLYKFLNKIYVVEDVRYNKTIRVFLKENISECKYFRNSIIIEFIDISKFDVKSFLELDIEEHTIEDNTLAFKFTGGKDYNYILFLKIKERIEGGNK